MQRRRGSQAAVELVEDGAPVAGARDATPSPRGRYPSRRAWWSVAGAAALALAVAAVAQARAEDAHEQRLARLAGAGPSLDEPLTPAWESAFRGTVGMHEHLLIAGDPDEQGLVAIDTRDGTVRWRQDRVADTWGCQLTSGGWPMPSVAGTATADAKPPLLVCQRHEGDDAGQVHVLDATTGRVERTLSVGATMSGTVLAGPDLAAIGLADDDHVTAGRWSLRTGEQRWSYRSEAPVADADRSQQSFGLADETLDARVGSWRVVLDATTGEPLPTAAPQVVHESAGHAREDGTVVRTRLGDGAARTEARAADGSLLWERDGYALRPDVDDGTAPGLELMGPATGRGVLGVDARTGEVRWEHAVAGTDVTGPPLVLAGLVLLPTGSGAYPTDPHAGLVALDADAGTVVWELDGGELTGWEVLTDGHRILTLDRVDSGLRLVAREVRTGTTAWSVPVPADAHSVLLLPDRGVLVHGDERGAVLRPPSG